MVPIRLIIGIGNPGREYARTRHNAGRRWVESCAKQYGIKLKTKFRLRSQLGQGSILGNPVKLLIPQNYVNRSGESVRRACDYFDVLPAEILVVYDEVAFPSGKSKLKFGGSSNGHNGVQNIITHMSGSKDFGRLRIGVGHPGDPSLLVKFLTREQIGQAEHDLIAESAVMDDEVFGWLLSGDWQRAMTKFHTQDDLSRDIENSA